jgi:subfamily B ATP-binding cassette protein MsbA
VKRRKDARAAGLTPDTRKPTDPTMNAASPGSEPTNRALAARLLMTYLRPRWASFCVSMVSAMAVAGLSAALIRILDPAINRMIVHREPGALATIPITIAVLAIGRAFAQILQARLVNRIGNAIVGQVQAQLFGKLVHADLARLRSEHTGAYVSSVLYDAGLIREAATSGVVNYTQNALIVAGALAVMFYYDPWLAGAVLLVGPIAGWVMRRYSKRTTRAAKGAMAETSALASAIMESLDGIKIVKIENREAYEEQRVAAVIERRQRHLISNSNAKATAAPVSEVLMTLVTAAVLTYAGWRASHGGMNIGALVAFIAALSMAGQSLRLLANLGTVVSEGLTAARRLFAALDITPEVGDAPGAVALAQPAQAVRFEDVSFAYGDNAPALDHVSLSVERGETVALVGPSGGGKSTILNLIPRFYDVTGGSVSLDRADVRGLTLASLRRQIALVTQEPFLFDDTIRANIAYADPAASDAQIEAAARQAAAHDFILALPKGYGALVGEAGTRLSGGQRQRIAIARAFLKNAPILLLDEATSALDTESEAQVQAALERLMAGRATLLIAHRLSTVKGADRIYVIDKGRVVETGTHAQLMRARGLYARLARAQNLEPSTEAAE